MSSTVVADREDGPAILPAVWRYRWMVVGIALLLGLAAFGVSLLQPVRYQADASLILSDTPNASVFSDPQPQFGDPNRHVRNQAQRITSTQATAAIAERLSFADLDEVRERLSAEPSDELDQITISALGETPERAVELADTAAAVYEELVTEEVTSTAEEVTDELQAVAAQLEERIAALDAAIQANPEDVTLVAERDAAVTQLVTVRNRAEQIAVDASLYGAGVEFYEPPEIPESPVQPQLVRNTGAGLALGLLAGAALAWWRAQRAEEAGQRPDAAAALGGPLLGEVPDFQAVGADGPVPTASAPRSMASEAYHFIAAALEYELDQVLGTSAAGARAVLVTSAGAADGKTTTALNLAVAIAREGRRVRLVDGDGRMRGLSRLAKVERHPGLLDLADGVGEQLTDIEQLTFGDVPLIPAGRAPTDPASFFRSSRFRRAMDLVKGHADVVVVDSPPLLAVADTAAMTSEVDGIVIVVDDGTTYDALVEVRKRLEFVSAPLLGYVLNRAETRLAAYGGYGYHQLPPQVNGNGARPPQSGRHARGRKGPIRRLLGLSRSSR